MPLMRRANESMQSEWRNIPEGVFEFEIGKPEVKLNERFGNYQVRFPLSLTEKEKARVMAENPMTLTEAKEGVQQSWRVSYTTGLSLGYMDNTGQYKSTKLTDMMAAAFGHANSKAFRQWIVKGGGPPRPEDKNDQMAELELIEEWLGWLEGLELIGSIRHAEDSSGNGKMWARFGGPMAKGSLPGQRDEEYQAFGRGKLRAMIAAAEGTEATLTTAGRQPVPDDKPAERFTAEGEEVDGELPF